MLNRQPGSFRCIVCENENIQKVSGIVNAGISASVGNANTIGGIIGSLGGGIMSSSTTNSSVTVSHLAHLLQFEAPPRGCMTSSFRWKRLLQGYKGHWDNLWYCSRCDNVFNALTGGYAPPQSVKQLYQLVLPVQQPSHLPQPARPPGNLSRTLDVTPNEAKNQLVSQVRSGQIIREDWFVVLSLFVFAPVGVVFVWLNPRWDERTKKIATFVGIVWFLIVCFSGHN